MKKGKGMLPHTMLVSRGHKKDYVDWDDPDELVDRLLLDASYQAAMKAIRMKSCRFLKNYERLT